jgi:glycosyltransferase involved in cell wall biosynthesis
MSSRPSSEPLPVAHVSLSVGARSETFVDQTLGALDRRGWPSYVYGIDQLGELASVPEARVRILPEFSRLQRISGRLRGTDPCERFGARMVDAARADGTAIVHAHFGWSGVFAVPLAERLGVPLVVTFYGSDAIAPDTGHGFARRRSAPYSRLFTRADAVIAVSEFVESALRELGFSGEVLVIRNGVDLEQLRQRGATPPPAGPWRIGFVGRLISLKGADVLLRSAAELLGAGREVILELVGDGPERSALQELAAELGIGDQVRMHGALAHPDTLNVIRSCHVMTVPTRVEPSGATDSSSMVFKEALALGVPVVATSAGGLPETCPPPFRQELAAPDDHRELAAAIERILLRPEEWGERASRGRAWVSERFSLDRLADELIACYQRLANVEARSS